MPLVRIALRKGTTAEFRRALPESVHRAMVETIGIPEQVRKSLFARIAARLREAPGVRPEDVFINLVETQKENWSFGNGVAQYAT